MKTILPDNLPEKLTLKEACSLTQRGGSTIRSWISKGYIDDLRPANSGNTPIQIRTDQLRSYLEKAEQGKQKKKGADAGPKGEKASSKATETFKEKDDQTVLLLQAQQDSLVREVAQLRAEVSALKRQLEEKDLVGTVRSFISNLRLR